METTKSSQVITSDLNIAQDIRQSSEWCSFLEKKGWKIFTTSKGTNVLVLNFKIGALSKIQRAHDLDIDELKEIEVLLKSQGAWFILVEPGVTQNYNNLLSLGFIPSTQLMSPTATVIIDLKRAPDVLWNDLSQSARYSVNRSKREQTRLEIVREPSRTQLEHFYTLYEATTKVQNFHKISFDDMFLRISLFKENAFLILAYDKDNQLLNGRVYLANKNCVWYLFGGTSDLGRGKNKAGYELQWESFLYFKNLGFEYLDLEGVYDGRLNNVRKDWEGLSYYKQKFGGTLVEYPLPCVKYLSPVFKIINKISFGKFSL